ncbi:hypothetical protein BDQ12DRAFT_630849 [Crucibulum laeve]|uniref:DUF2470 domain-containing protein n=1 Tax=Crucibulum laeve TaxID=68775 RepID=A0A5C3LYT2_9AGAR|nr:hypothetical protein BDQ12DRAFT_630849 [Crucibulum laeve]
MSDPVADKSGFLKMYMSNHPDTLVAYAKWYGKVKETIVSAEMSGIDTKSMTLTCTLKDNTKKVVRVPIEPPLAGYDDVKPRLLEMKAHAQEGLGMIKAPQITSFHLPREAIAAALLVFTVAYLHLSPRTGNFPLFAPAHIVHGVVGSAIISFSYYLLLVLHVFESAYTFSLCRKHKTPFGVGLAYVASTFILGFPVWKNLRRRIQAARIDSVMKIQ